MNFPKETYKQKDRVGRNGREHLAPLGSCQIEHVPNTDTQKVLY